ncbi:MAG: NAD-dependent epimerase/dehydratase family protein [Promethearchaeota archaeon]
MKNILVTGSTGFLGIPLVKKLSSLGHNLKLLVRESSDISPFEDLKNIKYITGDITDIDSIYEAAENVDIIYHLAGYVKIWAKDKKKYDMVNVDGTENAAKVALDKDILFFYASSFGALGPNPDGQVCDETYQHVNFFQNDYERTKFLGREVVKDYMNQGLKAIIFYPGFIFGPGDFNIYGEMMFDIVAGQFLGLPGKGESLFCMAYIDDVINGMISVIDRDDLIGEGFFLGGENITINDYLNLASEIARTKKPRHFPMWGGVLFARACKLKARLSSKRIPYITPAMIVGMKYNWAFSSKKANEKIGYKITPIREALETTVKWYQDFIEKNGKKKKKIGIRCSLQ